MRPRHLLAVFFVVVPSTALATIPAPASSLQAQSASPQEPSGPWAKFDERLKGEALYRDASAGDLESVRSIVQGGGNVNWRMSYGETPLMGAAGSGNAEVVRFLLAQGADPSPAMTKGAVRSTSPKRSACETSWTFSSRRHRRLRWLRSWYRPRLPSSRQWRPR